MALINPNTVSLTAQLDQIVLTGLTEESELDGKGKGHYLP